MPIYEYQCKKCETIFEQLSFKNEKLICPNCLSEEVSKIMSLSSFKLKGKGWSKDSYSKQTGKKPKPT